MGAIKELEDNFTIVNEHAIFVSKHFQDKYDLTLQEIHELLNIIDDLKHFKSGTTISYNVYKVLQDYNINLCKNGIGWKY